MIELREVLAAQAEGAPSYDVADAVLRGARRRHRIRRALPAVAAAAVLALVTPVIVSVVTGPSVPVVAADRPAGHGTIPWLPEKLSPGMDTPVPLPVSRAVGPAALVWLPCEEQCAPRLVTSDGDQYALPMYRGVGFERTALSPDGKWLSYLDSDGSFKLRDLSGTRTLRLANRRVIGWSPDSRWAAVTTEIGRPPLELLRLPEDKGAVIVQPSGEQRGLAGLTTAGEAVFGASRAGEVGDPISLRVTERNGASRLIEVTTDGKPWESEELTQRTVFDADGGTVLLQEVAVTGRIGVPADLLRIDLSDGSVLGRIRLPEPDPGEQPRTLPDGGETGGGGGESRGLLAAGPGGALLAHVVGSRTVAVESVDLTTGERRVVCTIAGGALWITIRGETMD